MTSSFVTFCVAVLRLVLTDAWRVLLMVAIDGVQPRDLVGGDRELARQLFGDVDEIDPRVRRVLIWRLGRSSGKSTIAAALAIFCAFTLDLSRSGPGQVPVAFVVSPSKPVAKIAVGIARALMHRAGLERLITGDTSEGFTLQRPDGRVVEIRSVAASKGGANLRGRDVIVLVLDESEFFASNSDATADGYAVTDVEQVQAVMPRLLGFVLCSSTPWPTANYTAEQFDRNWGRPSTALAALGPSLVMRPSPELADDYAREMVHDSENAEREFDCKVSVRGGGRFFDPAAVDACPVAGRPLMVSAPRHSLLGCGGDLGLERDSSAVAVVALAAGVYELLEHDEVRPAKDAPLQPRYVIRQRFAPLMKRHGAFAIMLDAHYRQSAIEHLDAEGLRFVDAPPGNQGKYDSYMQARAIIHGGCLRLPPSPRLLAQLKSIIAVPLPGGLTRITAPRRAGQGHGDIVSALVLALASLPSYGQRREREAFRARVADIDDQFALRGYGSRAEREAALERNPTWDDDSEKARRRTAVALRHLERAPQLARLREETKRCEAATDEAVRALLAIADDGNGDSKE